MKARSAILRSQAPKKTRTKTRLPYGERRALVLSQAADFFSEYGLTGQTRSLAAACGVSQRLLYRLFPNKAALLDEVYNHAILGPFKSAWFELLADRRKEVEQRLNQFYGDYYENILTRKWLRLFLYSSLAEGQMASNYIGAIIMRLLETIVEEVAHEQNLALPSDKAVIHEVGWTLHGAISHFAIRRHLYDASQTVVPETVIAMHIHTFLSGFANLLKDYQGPRLLADE